jgi:uncharacterized protein (DUF2267 family)
MTVRSIQSFEHALHGANEWLKELAEHPEVQDQDKAYTILRAVLHALRDQLTVEEAAHFSAQLPMLVRGVYFERWQPASVPRRQSREEFMAALHDELLHKKGVHTTAEQAVTLVIRLLYHKLHEDEIKHIQAGLPRYLRELFPNLRQ